MKSVASKIIEIVKFWQNSPKFAYLALVLLVCSIALPHPASAEIYELSYGNEPLYYGAGTYVVPGTNPYVPAGATAILSTAPSLTLDSAWVYNQTAVTFNGGEEQWIAEVAYNVTVNVLPGGTAGVTVPIDVTYFMSAAVTVGYYAIVSAGFGYDTNYTPITLMVGPHVGASASSGGTLSFTELSGATFSVFFGATETFYGLGDSGQVFIDPVYTIDPSFALTDPNYLSDYSLSFAGNVQNIGPAAVPETGSLSLLVTGLVALGGIGFVRKQRRA